MSGDEDTDDLELRAAIAASLRDLQESGDEHDPVPTGQPGVVDLTADSDNEVEEIYPKSKSVVESETEDDDEDDMDLKRAIAMSMQGVPDEGNDDDELEEAIKMPTQNNSKGRDSSEKPSPEEVGDKQSPVQTEKPTQDQKPTTGLSGLDRKQMEQERLARLAKRKAEDIPSTDRETKHLRTAAQDGGLDVETPRIPVSDPQPLKDSNPIKVRSRTDIPTATPSIQFPTGATKMTWKRGIARKGEDIRIEEVFQASDLELAVLSSFMWDTEWLFSKLNTRTTRFVMIMQAKDESTKRQYESETATMKNLRLCFPPMDGQINCMHSKLMLLFHGTYVRIVVPTANLTPYDWGCVPDAMENSLFLIDLPKKSSPSESPKTAFYEELVYFLKSSTLHESIIAKLDNFDFSQTDHIAFVHTIGGSHLGESWRRTGYCGLGRAVASLGLRSSTPVNIDYVTSSIGSLNDEFLRSIYFAAQGDDGLSEYTLRTNKPSSRNRNPPPTAAAEEWKHNRFRVYFPSEKTVNESCGGPNGAGTICFQSKWYENPKFPRDILRDCESNRKKELLMHNKIMYIQPDEPITLSDTTTCPAWAYIGSANLSESAWGRLVQERTTKTPKLNCRNWECGVVIPVLDHSNDPDKSKRQRKDEAPVRAKAKAEGPDSTFALDVFHGTVPVVMLTPTRKYIDTPGLRPWYFMG